MFFTELLTMRIRYLLIRILYESQVPRTTMFDGTVMKIFDHVVNGTLVFHPFHLLLFGFSADYQLKTNQVLRRVIHVGTKHSDVIHLLVDDYLPILIITNVSNYAASREFKVLNKVELWVRILTMRRL